MLITKETDYAMRILRALASGQRLTTTELAKNEQVPKQFAYKILKKLQKSGLVTILRGTDGGCILAKDLSTVTLYDLMQAMEEDHALISCMRNDYECQWRQTRKGCVCHAHEHLAAIQENLMQELSAHSLQQILFGS